MHDKIQSSRNGVAVRLGFDRSISESSPFVSGTWRDAPAKLHDGLRNVGYVVVLLMRGGQWPSSRIRTGR